MRPGRRLLALLFPTRCIICRELLDGGRPRICPRCAERLPYTTNGGKRHGDFFSLSISSVYYEGAMRKAMHRYKFGGARVYATAFGTLLASTIYEHLEGQYDLMSWVPLDAARLRQRGYDQARLLAERAAEQLCRECVPLLEKKRGVRPQSGTGSPERRRANIAGAYRVPEPSVVEGKRILLIDDMVTTGATMSECAKTLLLAGAEDVCCATLARTRDK